MVRYFIDASDGAVGSVPTEVKDAETPALNLSVEAVSWGADADPQREGVAPHGGLAWSLAPGSDARASAAIGSGKVFSRLNGKQALTVELVVRAQAFASTTLSRLFGLHTLDGNGDKIDRLSLVAGGLLPSGGLGAYWNQQTASYAGDLAGQWTVDLSTRQVVHLVVETSAPQLERVRLYVNGSHVPGEAGVAGLTPPSANEQLSLQANDELVLGNAASGGSSFQGVLYYAAVYDEALDEPRIAAHACALLASDDAPP
ncbi:uncharacterized protein CMC5_066200 [Chondromyces crocatus]|uniref:LamG-like jellyroll fold domain-containing protein n=1 Tax=Chondromyces crocatus TaxID=52 RepID=A0A0K1ENI0_CHOCO|nr:uncharacterized protein CMC5_066200 [Chondromyces crocatus]